jgi:hypothetical protein
MRVLVAAIQQHECVAPTEGFTPYMRLNVLSDILWERHAPWLFELFPRLQFYDYTKVPGRLGPKNYHLVFSFSGENENLCKQELEEFNRDVAVVFIAHKAKGKHWEAWRKTKSGAAPIPVPDYFWGYPVVDGDISDVRPLDHKILAERGQSGPAIIALRWKSPSLKKSGLKEDPIEKLEEDLKAGIGAKDRRVTFVTPTYVVDGHAVLDRPNPWSRPNPDEEQFLISAATPRFTPIDQDVAAPE